LSTGTTYAIENVAKKYEVDLKQFKDNPNLKTSHYVIFEKICRSIPGPLLKTAIDQAARAIATENTNGSPDDFDDMLDIVFSNLARGMALSTAYDSYAGFGTQATQIDGWRKNWELRVKLPEDKKMDAQK